MTNEIKSVILNSQTVIITIFNKLNNLLLKGDISPEIYSAILLHSEGNGSVSSIMTIDDLGVDDTNFLDVAQALYNEREDLISSWNNN